jgi:hypothetical protein
MINDAATGGCTVKNAEIAAHLAIRLAHSGGLLEHLEEVKKLSCTTYDVLIAGVTQIL